MAAPRKPILIAHRGASGHLPEHTLPGYALAILQGADYIEPDLVSTKDGVLVARHENEIGGTTDVAQHPEFAARRRTQRIDGEELSGWFTEDFTLAELKTLRARERIPELRPGNTQYDGRFEVPTFDEILEYLGYINATRTQAGLPAIGVYPETKHPSHFASIGLALEPPLLAALKRGLGVAPVFIQCFEVGNLRALRKQCDYPLVQLMSADGGPWDEARNGLTYAAMAQPAGLKRVAQYAHAIGVQKNMVLAEGADGSLAPTSLVADAHAAGLSVHAWTFRAENTFLPQSLRRGNEPAAHGDMAAEITACVAAGLDGLFSDYPDLAHAALSSMPVR
jgi:glycerophosphoryl diester phosphodiesterase